MLNTKCLWVPEDREETIGNILAEVFVLCNDDYPWTTLLRDSSLEHVGRVRRKSSSGPNMVLVQKMKRKVRSKLVQRSGIVEMNYAVCAEAVTSEQIVCVGENPTFRSQASLLLRPCENDCQKLRYNN